MTEVEFISLCQSRQDSASIWYDTVLYIPRDLPLSLSSSIHNLSCYQKYLLSIICKQGLPQDSSSTSAPRSSVCYLPPDPLFSTSISTLRLAPTFSPPPSSTYPLHARHLLPAPTIYSSEQRGRAAFLYLSLHAYHSLAAPLTHDFKQEDFKTKTLSLSIYTLHA